MTIRPQPRVRDGVAGLRRSHGSDSAVCGICGIVSARRPGRPRSARRDVGDARAPRARLGGHVRRRRRRARGAAARDHRPRRGGDQPIANEDGTCTVVQNGEIYNYRELTRELERAGHRFRTHSRHRGARPRLRGVGPRVRRAAARDVRGRDLGRARGGGSCSRATASGSSRSTTATTAARSRSPPSSTRCPRGEIDLDALEAFLAFNSIPAPLSIFREIRKLPRRARARSGTDGGVELERYARPGPLPRARTTTTRPSSSRSAARACATRCARTSSSDVPVGVLLSGGVDSGALAALAAQESSEPVRTFSIGFEEASFDELAGARAVAERYGTRHRELVAAAGRGAAPARARGRVRRAVRRLVGAADVPRLAARRRGREGRALRRGRRRALRRLLHLRRRPARRARRRRSRRLARPLVERLPTSTRRRRASTTRRSASSAPRTCRRSSATTAGRRSSPPDARAELTRPAARLRPGRRYRARFAETEGHELLARLQDVDFGIYLVDDLLVKTDRASMALVARGARAVPGHRRRRASRSRCRRGTRFAGSRRSACCGRPSSRCCRARSCTAASAASRSPPRPGCAASSSRSRARRSRPRRSAAGLLRARAGDAPARRPRRRRARTCRRQLWGLLAFTLWYERHVERSRRRCARAAWKRCR